MQRITRHDIDVASSDNAAELAHQEVDRHRGLIGSNRDSLLAIMAYSLEEALHLTAGDPEASWSDTWRAFARAMQASSAVFALAVATEGEIEFRLDDEVLSRQATGHNDKADVFVWTDAMYLAMVCRDRPRIDLLAAADVARGDHDEYLYTWANCLRTYWRRGDGLVDQLLEAMRGTEPANLRVRSKDAALKLDFPAMEMFYLLTQREDEKFNEALAKAVELHKEYWAGDQADPRGFVALGPLAIACLAREAGVRLTVRSPYLPAVLLSGARVGEVTL